MNAPTTATRDAARADGSQRLRDLEELIHHAAHLLPAQGPITVFVHHNTLHAFEDLPFEEAVLKGARIFGCEPYLPEDRYREMLVNERIRIEDLSDVLEHDLGEGDDRLIGFMGTRHYLRLAMLTHPLRLAPPAELRWVVAETDALRIFRDDVAPTVRTRMIDETRHWVMRDLLNGRGIAAAPAETARIAISELLAAADKAVVEQWSESEWEAFTLQALWRLCYHGVHGVHEPEDVNTSSVRVRDVLLEATGIDSDEPVHEFLIRFTGVFLDQGFAHWRLPDRNQGFYRSFLDLYRQGAGPPDRWLHGLRREAQRLHGEEIGPLASIDESLEKLGVTLDEREEFISAILLSLRGYAGMVWQMETRGDRVANPAPPGSLIEFLAVRLILERFALAHAAREALGFTGALPELRAAARQAVVPNPARDLHSVEQRAFVLFQLAQVLGWKPRDLFGLQESEWSSLADEIEAFPSLERRRIYHQAYERLYVYQALSAIGAHNHLNGAKAIALRPRAASVTDEGSNGKARRPKFQLTCCIDDREESFRRHLEEVEPECETFGSAGFFGVAMYYRGLADAHFTPLCPIIIRPSHYVSEEPVYTFQESHRRRALTRRMVGTASHRWHVGSRSLLGGVFTALFGSLASIPLVGRVLFPRLTAQIWRLFSGLMTPPPVTQLRLERSPEFESGPAKNQMGYTLEEMGGIVQRQLEDCGLVSNFARLVIFTGHGSSSLNNPHESAYNCGACAGGRGGPNARAFAQMANDPRVRDMLTHRGLAIPSDTIFVAAYHNTCNDSVTFFDLDRIPVTHMEELEEVNRVIDEARERNAHERCRRFETAPLTLTPEAALRHVEGRAEDLAQTRPEYNHATNAITIVARRSRTRGLYLDRRTFVTSYDPTIDDDKHTILARILRAVIPVCSGISLEYYFSTVDPSGWGCGTKLPHNVTSLLAVMTGAASDLRPGLSNQMTEIHEPMRQLFVIESTPEAMHQIMDENEQIAQLCRNGWVYLAVLSPESDEIQIFHRDRFEPFQPKALDLPEEESSMNWYRGWRGNLGFARINVNARGNGRGKA